MPYQRGLSAPERELLRRRGDLQACIGETLAALEVSEASERAADPTLRALLQQIASDEARHAQLAWVMAHADPATRALVAAQFAAELPAAALGPAQAPPTSDAMVAAHGILEHSTRHELRRRGIDELVMPCAQALHIPVGATRRPATARRAPSPPRAPRSSRPCSRAPG